MGIVVRQSIKSVIITLVGAVLGAAVLVLSVKFFPKIELGFRDSLIKIALQVSYIGLFGFNFTLLIFGQKYPPGHNARGTFLTITAIAPLLLTLLVSACYFFFKNDLSAIYKNPEDAKMMEQYLILFPMLTLISAAMAWLEGYLQSLHKTALQNFAREILARLVYITLIVLFGFQVISFETFIWLYVITYIIPFLYLLIIAIHTPGLKFEYKANTFSIKEVKEIFRFSGYHMLTVVSSVLILQIDAVLLAPLGTDGFEAVAVYSVATLAIAMLRNPTRVIGIAATPAFTKSYNEGDLKMLKNLFTRSAINMQVIGLGMFVLVFLNLDNIVAIMALIKPGYSQIKLLILILMIGQLADMVTGLNYELIGVTKYYRFNFWIAIVLLVVVILLNFILIKDLGIYGAAWATTIGLVIFNIAKTVFLWRKLKMQPFSTASFKILLAGMVAGVLAWILPFVLNVYIDAMVRSAIFCAVLWITLYKFKVSQELNEVTDNMITKKRFY